MMNRANRSAQARLLLDHVGNDATLVNARINLDENGIPACVDTEEREGTLILSPCARAVLERTLSDEQDEV